MLALIDLRLSRSKPLCGCCGKPATAGRAAASTPPRLIVVVGVYGSVVINFPSIYCCGKLQAVHALEFGTVPNTPFTHASVFYQARAVHHLQLSACSRMSWTVLRPLCHALRRRSCCNLWVLLCCTRSPHLTA